MNIDMTIYMDALGLLLSDKINIKNEIEHQVQQGDDYFLDQIAADLCDVAEQAGFGDNDIDALNDQFYNDSVRNLMDYLVFDEKDITFDYEESAACGDSRVVAFIVPCIFDSERYITKWYEMMQTHQTSI